MQAIGHPITHRQESRQACGLREDGEWVCETVVQAPSLGNEFTFSVWAAYNVSDWVSFSMRGLFEQWGDVSGSDPGTDGTIDPSANSFAQGGERVQIPFGISFFLREGPAEGHRLLLEWYYPVHEDLNGPQLSTESTFVISWQTFF